MSRTWNAKWICHPKSAEHRDTTIFWEEGERNAYYLFRKEFELAALPAEATAFITASSWYRLHINGSYVERGPVQSPPFYKYYDKLDVSRFLRKGRNTVAVELHITGKSYQGGLLLEIASGDGAALLCSNANWKSCNGDAWNTSARFYPASLYCPWQEIFDARRMPEGWLNDGFDDSKWQNAHPLRSQRGNDTPPSVQPWLYLLERDIPQLRREAVRPERIAALSEQTFLRANGETNLTVALSAAGTQLKDAQIVNAEALLEGGSGACAMKTSDLHLSGFSDGVKIPSILLDFGKIIRGTLEMELEGPAGAKLDIGYAENLVDGQFNNQLCCSFADSVTLKQGVNKFSPFCWKAFRYVKLLASECFTQDIRIKSFRANLEQYPFDATGCFKSSDKQLNAIYSLCEHTIDLCTADNIFDTPHREQGQWMYDAAGAILNGLLYAFGETRMARKFLRQSLQPLLPTGLPAFFSNAWYPDWKVYTDAALWHPHALWSYYMFSGDGELLDELHPRVCLLMEFYRRRCAKDGILESVPNPFIDWGFDAASWKLPGGTDARSANRSAPINALYAWSLERFDSICARYGDEKQRKLAADAHAALKSSFAKTFWDDSKGCVADAAFENGRLSAQDSEYANAIAILAGLLDEEQTRRAIESVFEKRTANAIEAAPFASLYVLKALSKAGRFDLAMKVLRERWGARWADKGFSSAGENWAVYFYNGSYSGVHTQSHAWSAGPCEFLIADMLGLEIIEPGFSKIKLSPRQATADCAIELLSPKGLLKAECASGRWTFKLPAGVKAEIAD